MDLITALALVIGVMGGIATFVAVTAASAYFVIWVTFVAWASFYAAGGDDAATVKSIAANVWGALIATLSLLAFNSWAEDGKGVALKAGVCVGIAIVVLILGAKIPALGFIPGQVFGYAPTAGLFLGGYATFGKLFGAAVISLIIGNLLGIISAKVGGAVAKS
jgi:hypothetical protein